MRPETQKERERMDTVSLDETVYDDMTIANDSLICSVWLGHTVREGTLVIELWLQFVTVYAQEMECTAVDWTSAVPAIVDVHRRDDCSYAMYRQQHFLADCCDQYELRCCLYRSFSCFSSTRRGLNFSHTKTDSSATFIISRWIVLARS